NRLREARKEVRIGEGVSELRTVERRVTSLAARTRQPVERLVDDFPFDGRRVRAHWKAIEVAPAGAQKLPSAWAGLDVVEQRAAPRGWRISPHGRPLQLVEAHVIAPLGNFRRATAAGRSCSRSNASSDTASR